MVLDFDRLCVPLRDVISSTGRAYERGVQGVHRTRVKGGQEELRLSPQVLDQFFFFLLLFT